MIVSSGSSVRRSLSSAWPTVLRLGQRDEIGVHQPAGGRGVVAEQRPHLPLLPPRQQLEHRLAAFPVELAEQVGGVVCLHRREHVRGLLVGALAQELDLMLGIELLEHVGLQLAVCPDGTDDLLAFLVRGGLDQVGDLRRMQLRQPAEPHSQPRGRHVADERLDVRPVEEGPHRGAPAQRGRQHAAKQRAEARVHADQTPPAVHLAQHEIVGTHETSTDDVDHVAPQQVLAEEHLALTPLEPAEVDLFPRSCTPPGSSFAMRSAGTNTSRPPIRAFTPLTGGYPPSASRTIRSSTRPSFSPARSTSRLPRTEERLTSGISTQREA